MAKLEKLGKRKMITAFKVYFEKEYTSGVADYAKRINWERLSCHGYKVVHDFYFGVDSIVWEFPDGRLIKMPTAQFLTLYSV